MLFSFLIPVYNAEKYLEACVGSLLAQKGADFEILLLDDGSTDGSPKRCDDLQAAHPGVVRVIHKANEGPLLTRRSGFRAAAGDWIICVDADDRAAPDLLETVAAAIEAHAGCDMVMYNYQYVDDRGEVSPSRLKIPDGTVFSGAEKQRLYALRLTTTLVNNMWMRAIRRDIIDFDADYSGCGIRGMCDDALQMLPLYTAAQKTVFIDRPLYLYRKGDGSITSRTTLAHWQAIHRSFALEQPYVERWNIPTQVQCIRYTRQMENICNCARWLYRNHGGGTLTALLRQMKEESMFRECLAHYDKKYAATRYSALCMPVIARALAAEAFWLLKIYFGLERRMLRK